MIKSGIIFLVMNGNCGEALDFYKKTFEATITERVTYAEGNASENKSSDNKIMNSSFTIGNMNFSAYDTLENVTDGNNISIWLEVSSKENIETLFKNFKDTNSLIISDLDETFWNSLYFKVQDEFGIFWELNFQK